MGSCISTNSVDPVDVERNRIHQLRQEQDSQKIRDDHDRSEKWKNRIDLEIIPNLLSQIKTYVPKAGDNKIVIKEIFVNHVTSHFLPSEIQVFKAMLKKTFPKATISVDYCLLFQHF